MIHYAFVYNIFLPVLLLLAGWHHHFSEIRTNCILTLVIYYAIFPVIYLILVYKILTLIQEERCYTYKHNESFMNIFMAAIILGIWGHYKYIIYCAVPFTE